MNTQNIFIEYARQISIAKSNSHRSDKAARKAWRRVVESKKRIRTLNDRKAIRSNILNNIER